MQKIDAKQITGGADAGSMRAARVEGCWLTWGAGGMVCQGREAGGVGQKIFNLKTRKTLPNPQPCAATVGTTAPTCSRAQSSSTLPAQTMDLATH